MVTHPNNTLAQYITNLPRRISLSGDWECGLTEIHYPHDWYNVQNSRMAVEYGESVHNVFLADGYYDSPETLIKTLNGEKPGRVQFSYNSVTQKVMRSAITSTHTDYSRNMSSSRTLWTNIARSGRLTIVFSRALYLPFADNIVSLS